MVMGIVGLLAGWCLLGLPCIAAVILGHIETAATANGARSGRGMAVAGLVMGYIGVLPAVIVFFWLVFGAGAAVVSPTPTATPSGL
ncbi:DUF4190 domain-containing protein [Actinoplanes sp. NPDC051494]|uniref:DUF4190 domain-containing protein n=1 Tax=Actinoplanes sp. NPDC051494 TaxID=3363907 RepID=UPI0037A0D836